METFFVEKQQNIMDITNKIKIIETPTDLQREQKYVSDVIATVGEFDATARFLPSTIVTELFYKDQFQAKYQFDSEKHIAIIYERPYSNRKRDQFEQDYHYAMMLCLAEKMFKRQGYTQIDVGAVIHKYPVCIEEMGYKPYELFASKELDKPIIIPRSVFSVPKPQ